MIKKFLLLGLAIPFQDVSQLHTSSGTEVQGLYAQPKYTPPPPPTLLKSNRPAPRRLLEHAVPSGSKGGTDNANLDEHHLNEDVYEDKNDHSPMSHRRILQDASGSPIGISGDVTGLEGPAFKQENSKTYHGELFSKVGCAYRGRDCTTFYYPYSTYLPHDKSTDSSKVAVYDGYRQPYGVTGETTDYKWNVMSSFPYIAKSPLFGRIEYGKPFDDVETSLNIVTGKVAKVTIFGTERVTSIRVEYEGGQVIQHGTQWEGELAEAIDLAKDEHIVEGKFSNCKVHYDKANAYKHTRLCGATLITTNGRKVSRGRFGKIHHTVAPNGFVFAGLFGREGENIDQIGLVAINTDALNAARKAFPVEEFGTTGWYNAGMPGIASSRMRDSFGNNFNLAYMMPFNIQQMKLIKLSVYANKEVTGMTFTYQGGAEIDIGAKKGEPAIVDLGLTGRVTRIAFSEYLSKKGRKGMYKCFYLEGERKCYRFGGVVLNYIDSEGKEKEIVSGRVTIDPFIAAPENTLPPLDIPPHYELVAAHGAQGDVLDSLAFLIRRKDIEV